MKNIKKTALFLAMALVLFGPISGVLPGFAKSASADENQGGYASSDTIDGQILDHQLYYYVVGCAAHVDIDSIGSSDMNNWQWFASGGINANSVVRGGMYSIVASGCDDGARLKEAMGRFGFSDPVKAYCQLSLGYNEKFGGYGQHTKYGDDAKACELGNGSDGQNWDMHGGKGDQEKSFAKLLNSTTKGKTAAGDLSDAAKYVRSYRTLMNGCGIDLQGAYDASQQSASNNNALYKVGVVTIGDDSTPVKNDYLGITTLTSEPDWGLSGGDTPSQTGDPGTDGFKVPLVATTSGGLQTETCGELALDTQNYAQAYVDYLTQNPDEAQVSGTGASDDGSDDVDLQCAGFSLKTFTDMEWLICPLTQGMMDLANSLEDQITKYLCINEGDIFENASSTCTNSTGGTDSATAFHEAWGIFRTFALGLLAIAGLIMIISQGLGFEFIDAYTIKKVLPRILVAAIGISLSWPILQFLVTLSNVLGIGIRSILYAPFQHAGIDHIDVLNGGSSIIATLIGAGSFVALGALGLLSFVGTAALAIMIAFFTLIIRSILVIFLIIVAPLAIAAYILPNTEKYWKLWWEWLFKGLMVFPIITGMIAMGHIFAAITTTKDGGTLTSFVAFAAYFAPYFLIPAAFRFAGGALSTIGGFANDRSRGAFDRLSKFRQGQTAKNWEKTKNFDRFSERSRLGRGLNTALGAAANPTSMLGGGAGVAARRHANQTVQGAAMLKENKVHQANMNDDNYLLALANRDLAQQKIDQVRAKRDYAIKNNTGDADKHEADLNARQKGMDAANQLSYFDRENRSTRLAALDGLTKTGYQLSEGAQGYKELNDTVNSIVGPDERARAQLMDNSQFNLKSAGRFDLGGINHGAGYNSKTGLDKASLYEMANGKPETINTFGKALPGGAVGEEHAIVYKELESMLPNTKGGNRDAVVAQMETLEARGIREHMAGTTTEQQVIKLTADRARQANDTGNPWTVAELNQGWRHENRTVTNSEVASRKARAYERPDPNHDQH